MALTATTVARAAPPPPGNNLNITISAVSPMHVDHEGRAYTIWPRLTFIPVYLNDVTPRKNARAWRG